MRGPKARIKWFLSNKPGRGGLCARHTWHSLGPGVPALGAPDANAVVRISKAKGHLHAGRKKRKPPKGAVVLWSGGRGRHGHAALSMGNGKIASTDVHGANTVGVVDLGWVERHWHYKYEGWLAFYGNKRILKGYKR